MSDYSRSGEKTPRLRPKSAKDTRDNIDGYSIATATLISYTGTCQMTQSIMAFINQLTYSERLNHR